MSDSDPVAFRRAATRLYRRLVQGLAVLAFSLAGLGWLVGGLWGLALGAVLGCVLAGVGLVAGGILWAMTQDGA